MFSINQHKTTTDSLQAITEARMQLVVFAIPGGNAYKTNISRIATASAANLQLKKRLKKKI